MENTGTVTTLARDLLSKKAQLTSGRLKTPATPIKIPAAGSDDGTLTHSHTRRKASNLLDYDRLPSVGGGVDGRLRGIREPGPTGHCGTRTNHQ